MDIDEQQEWDDRDAAIFQQQMEERRRREEETEQWTAKSMREFKRQLNEWLNDFNEQTRSVEHGDHGERYRW